MGDRFIKSNKDVIQQEFFMPIQDVFHITTNRGPTVTGKIEKGEVKLGDELILVSQKNETTVKVIRLEKFQEVNLKEIGVGIEDVGITLTGISHNEIKRGAYLKKIKTTANNG